MVESIQQFVKNKRVVFVGNSVEIMNHKLASKIDSYDISEGDKESIVGLQIVSNWADFAKKNGRKTNNTSQQRFFSTDVGMDFASQTVQDIKWGRA